MIQKNKKSKTKISNKDWYSLEEVFEERMKSKKFRDAYFEELSRLQVARQVRLLRQSQKMTQKDVASKAHMPQSVIARIESGTHSISVDTLGRIAHALGKKIQLA